MIYYIIKRIKQKHTYIVMDWVRGISRKMGIRIKARQVKQDFSSFFAKIYGIFDDFCSVFSVLIKFAKTRSPSQFRVPDWSLNIHKYMTNFSFSNITNPLPKKYFYSKFFLKDEYFKNQQKGNNLLALSTLINRATLLLNLLPTFFEGVVVVRWLRNILDI